MGAVAALALGALASSALAAPVPAFIDFNPNGTGNGPGVFSAQSFDQRPGNAAQFGTIPLPNMGSNQGTVLFQSQMSAFVAQGGGTVPLPAGTQFPTTAALVEQNTSAGGFPGTVTFSLVNSLPNQFTISVTTNPINDDTGAGYSGNHAILTAHFLSVTGSFTATSANAGNLDQTAGENHGPATVGGSGSQDLFLQVDSVDPNYFPNINLNTTQLFLKISSKNSLPYTQVAALDPTGLSMDPAGSFFNGQQVNVGAPNGTNGLTGPDILLETDLSTSFLTDTINTTTTIPEPSTLLLSAFGLAGLGAANWLRRRRAARA